MFTQSPTKVFRARGVTLRWSSSLVTPQWLYEVVDDRKSGAIRVLDCDDPIAFHRAHIPYATSFYGFSATNLKDTRPRTSGLIDKNQFKQMLDVMGIDSGSTLVFYDDELSLRATRAWWVFLHYGFPRDRIKVLNGGWRSWVLEMKDVSIGPSAHHSPPTTNGTPRLLDNVAKLIGLDRVQDALLTSSAKFVDTRSYEEYIGARDHGNHYVGHIPAALHFEWKDAMDTTKHGQFKNKDQLERDLIKERGLTKTLDQPIITYCQRGIRAAHTAFVLQEILGYTQVQVYEDSMYEYLNREDTAIE